MNSDQLSNSLYALKYDQVDYMIFFLRSYISLKRQ